MKTLIPFLGLAFSTCAVAVPSPDYAPRKLGTSDRLIARADRAPPEQDPHGDHPGARPPTLPEEGYAGEGYGDPSDFEQVAQRPVAYRRTDFTPVEEAPAIDVTDLAWVNDAGGNLRLAFYVGNENDYGMHDLLDSYLARPTANQRAEARVRAGIDLPELPRERGTAEEETLALLEDVTRTYSTRPEHADLSPLMKRYGFLHTVWKMRSTMTADQKNAPMVFINNRHSTYETPSPLPADFQAAVDFSVDTAYRPVNPNPRLRRRSGVVGMISGAESSNASDSSSNKAGEWEVSLTAMQNAQSKASALLIPIIVEMTSRSNSSLVWNAAWSIFSDLTASSPIIHGPFTWGMNCLEYIEDNLLNITHYDTSNPAQNLVKTTILATNKVLLELYNEAWVNATAALEAAGLLETMATLAGNLLPTDQSVIPSGYANYSLPGYDNSFFMSYVAGEPTNATFQSWLNNHATNRTKM